MKINSFSPSANHQSQITLLGHGVGLRSEHFQEILENKPKVDWFEAISENFMDTEGKPLRVLEKIRANYPIGLHGTSLSIGSAAGLSQTYLEKLKKLVQRIEPAIVSDHLCWSDHAGQRLFDLLPLPFTDESVKWVVQNVARLQDYLGRRILLENVSSYVAFKHSAMTEWEFLNEVAKQSGCGILLDVNNIYVNSFNHKFNPGDYLNGIDSDKVMQYHISGHTNRGKFLFDTHHGDVIQPVWDLYSEAVKRFGDVSSLVEWDSDIRGFDDLMALNEKSRVIAKQIEPRTTNHGPRKEKHGTSPVARGPNLLEVQSMFASEMLGKEKTTLADLLTDQAGDPGIDRMEVYAEGYPARVHEALAEAYPALLKVLGESIFDDLAIAFSNSRIFEHYNLNRVAEHFPEFLKMSSLNEKLPFLRDLAELELAIHRCFHAEVLPAASPADFADKAALDGENLIFHFQKHVFGVRSHWPILDVWNARREPREQIKIQMEGRPQAVLVYRAGEKVVCQKADTLEVAVLQSLMQGEPLGKALDVLAEADDISRVQQWFSGWLSNGLIASFQLAPAIDPRQ